MKTLLSLLCIAFQFTTMAKDNLKAFPQAKSDMKRFVIELDHKERNEEDNFRVELIIGKTTKVDGVNKYRLNATLAPKPLKGWGFTFYELSGNGLISSTRMAAPEGSTAVESFVTGTPLMIRYNSRIPIVVYVPKDYDVRYKVWSCPLESSPAQIK